MNRKKKNTDLFGLPHPFGKLLAITIGVLIVAHFPDSVKKQPDEDGEIPTLDEAQRSGKDVAIDANGELVVYNRVTKNRVRPK